MSGRTNAKPVSKTRRPLDFFVVLFCLSGAAISLNFFRADLMQTINSQNAPVGTVTVKHNTVQRRVADRVLWDRLFTESPVYSGDLIRVAELSDAVLHLDNKDIELNENTLIRIQLDKAASQLELFSGSLNLSTGTDGENLLLIVGGNQVEVTADTVLSAATGRGGMELRVSDGSALITNDGLSRTVNAGAIVSLNAAGVEQQAEPAAMVKYPRANARYLKPGPEPLNIEFAWNRINLEPGEPLRLRIAEDRNFTRIIRELTAIDAAETAFNTGLWYWQLVYKNTTLSSGRITVTNASGPVLLSPAMNQSISYRNKQPEIFFRWMEVADAAYYIMEAGEGSDFLHPRITRQISGTSFFTSELGPGTWYWQVRPVFPPAYIGSAGISLTSTFQIEQSDALEAPVLRSPAQGSVVDVTANDNIFHLSWDSNNNANSYTVQVADNPDLNNPVITGTVRDNFYAVGRNEQRLRPGQYYWGVYYTTEEGIRSPVSPLRSFIAMEENVIQRALFPPDGYAIAEELLPDTHFTWKSSLSSGSRFQISGSSDFSRMEIDVPVSGEQYSGCSLPAGNWFWRIYTNANNMEFQTPVRRINVTHTMTAPVPEAPRSGGQVMSNTGYPVEFRWQPVNGAEYYQFRLYTDADREHPVYENNTVNNIMQPVLMDTFAEGAYYWTVQAVAPQILATFGGNASRQIGPPGDGQFTLRRLQPVRLEAPTAGEAVPGLRALRQSITFRWSSAIETGRTRFVISQNPNPLRGQPARVILNPRQTFSIEPNTLGPGTWYWTIEAQTPEGYNISATAPRQLRVLPIPLLPAAAGRQPSEGHFFGNDELRANRSIVFSWAEVSGANAYIFTLFQETDAGRRYIIRDNLTNRTSWTLEDTSVLDQGKFVWQVEAVSRNRNGRFEQRGQVGTNSFTVEFTLPGPVLTRDTEVFYVE